MTIARSCRAILSLKLLHPYSHTLHLMRIVPRLRRYSGGVMRAKPFELRLVSLLNTFCDGGGGGSISENFESANPHPSHAQIFFLQIALGRGAVVVVGNDGKLMPRFHSLAGASAACDRK